jgi:WD40 repeat protein
VDRVLSLDFNGDGTLLAAGSGEPSRSGEVTIWETGKGMKVRRWEHLHTDVVYGVRFSPDGTLLATASADKLVKLLDVRSGRERAALEGHTHHVLGLDWSGDGRRLVSCGAEGVLKFWDAQAGEALRTTEPGDSGALNSVRWSRGPGAASIATASANGEARLWNPRNLNVTRRFGGAEGVLYCVALAADRTKIAAGGSEGVLYLWNPANAKLLRRIGGQAASDTGAER